MNLLRGILSIGVIIGCLLSWVEFETEITFFVLTGLTWVPVTILLYASVLTSGYAFYNSYRSSNENSWIYLTCGLYGIGTCIFIYLSVTENVDYFYTYLPDELVDSFTFTIGLGIYLTGLFSFLLFLTGFDKSDKQGQTTLRNFDQQDNSMIRQANSQSAKPENTDEPNAENWLKENPGKSINDYFAKFKA
jgi:hypothetical protein